MPPDSQLAVNKLWPTQPGQQSTFDIQPSRMDLCSTSSQGKSQSGSPFAPFSPPASLEEGDQDAIAASASTSRSSTDSPVGVPPDLSTSLLTALGAGRLDPFQVYCKKDLPTYVHGVLDHYLHHVCCSFTLAAHGIAQNIVMSYVMGHAMRDPLTWYAIILAGVTHYMFVHGEQGISDEIRLLRLSYKTQAMAEIRQNITESPDHVSESTLFAINTLANHGGAEFAKGFRHDRIQNSKAFGVANNVNYYSTVNIEWEHWNTLTRLMRQRGGPSTLSHPDNIPGFPPSPGPGCLTTSDTMIAWRFLRCPEFPLFVNTNQVIGLQPIESDVLAIAHGRKLSSGFPTMPKSNMHFRRLTALLKNTHKLVVDYEQYQRGAAKTLDLRLLYWTRLMLLHDLLLLPDLDASDNPMDLIYELCRNCLLAFMQLILCPIVASNRMPEKILKQLLPVLQKSTIAIHGRTLDREHPSLFLWALLLAGMLAMEHYQTQNDPALLDEVSMFIGRIPVKAEKNSWSIASKVAQTFLWLESECEGPGKRYWDYACLWLAERRHNLTGGSAT